MIKIKINNTNYHLLAFNNNEAICNNGMRVHWNSVKWVTIPYTVPTPQGLANILEKENWFCGGTFEAEVFMNKNCLN